MMAQLKTKPNGQSKITGSRSKLSQIHENIEQGKCSEQYYSLLMARESQPNKYAICLDFDHTFEGDAKL